MSVASLRVLIADRNKAAINEVVGEGDGVNRYFQFDMFPLVSSPTANVVIFLTGVTAATNSYTLSGDVGKLTFGAANAPANGATILAIYDYNALSSGELSQIESGYSTSPYLAAANACLVLAADATRFFAYTMGDKSVDKRRVADSLINLSKTLENRHYTMQSKNITGSVFGFNDTTGLPYYGFDTSVAYIGTDD